MERTNLMVLGAVAAVGALVVAVAMVTQPAPRAPLRGPQQFLTVVSGLMDSDLAWVDERYVPLAERLGLTPCGVLVPPETAGELSLGEGCELVAGRGTRWAEPRWVRGELGTWSIDIDQVWHPVPSSSVVDGVVTTPRGDGMTLLTDGERWCALPWTGGAEPSPLEATARVDLQRSRRATPEGVVLVWRGVHRDD